MDDVIASLKRINTLPLYSHLLTLCRRRPGRWISISRNRTLVAVTAGASSGNDPAARMGTLSNFASHPIGTGPYAVIRNAPIN